MMSWLLDLVPMGSATMGIALGIGIITWDVLSRHYYNSRQLTVNVKKNHPHAIIPTYAMDGDACFDLHAASIETTACGDRVYDTGLCFEIPEGYVGLVFPRSSIRNTRHAMRNAVGVIDAGYRGSVTATFATSDNMMARLYTVGDRVAQMMIIQRPEIRLVQVDTLSNTRRGMGGHGSTGI